MFEKACKLYWNLVCSVGNNGRAYGKGCMLTQRHAITALHVVKGPQRHKACPTIMKHDGLFACEVLLGSEQFDVALLCATKQIRSFEPAQPEGYPSISATKPFLGLSVGYIGSLTIEDDEEKRTHTFFSEACISYFLEDKKSGGLRYALSGGVIQKGFSGGPVFDQTSELVGLIVMSQRFAADMKHPQHTVYTLPIMSPLAFLKKDIESVIL